VTPELRSPEEVGAWVAAGLQLRRVRSDGDDAFVGAALAACAGELAAVPPPGVIADLAVLLAGAPLPLLLATAGDRELRAAIRAYDDDVLARLVGNPRYDDVLAAFAHVSLAERPSAVALVVGAICTRTSFAGVAVSAAALRRALASPGGERDARGRAALAGGEVARGLADAYRELARAARQVRELVGDREVFALDHLAVLRELGDRVTADHVAAAAEELGRAVPRRLPVNRQHRGARDTQLADDTLYPAGGFAAITPGGDGANLENLVTSELAYMEDGAQPDAFTLRYVESELLHYTRDDSVFRRHRHVIAFVLGADLEDARVKDRELPWQRLVLALGLVLAAIRWLVDQLGDEALAIRVAFPPGRLADERAILGLLLDAEIARGLVAVVEQHAGDAIAEVAAEAGTAIADLVIAACGAPLPAVPRGVRALHLELAAAAPAIAPLGAEPRALDDDPRASWRDAAEELLRWLV
jgi:hypothetical protein